jgi:hypothetical protein
MTEDQRFLVASDVGSGLRSDAKRLGASDIARFAGVPPWADEAVRDFIVQDRCRVPLPRLLPVSHGYDLLTEQEHDAIFSDNREGWKRLWARWPHVNGIVSLSRIGFTADRDCAFLALGISCDSLAGAGYYVLLVRTPEGWDVRNTKQRWIS